MGNATPGWYIDPEGSGQLRWWTGEAWTSALLTPPTSPTRSARRESRSRGKIVAITTSWVLGVGAIVVSALLLVSLVTAGVRGADIPLAGASDNSPAQASSSEAEVSDNPPPAAAPPKSAAQVQDEAQVAAGWSVIESGSLYGKFADKADYSCGYVKCSYFLVLTVNGCPAGLYVEASTLGGGTVVGMTNDLLSGVRAGETAAANLQIVDPGADSVRISKVECY